MSDMTSWLRCGLLLGLALLVPGCGGLQIDVDWDRAADFAAYRTWAWKPNPDPKVMSARFAEGSPLAEAVKEEVAALMAERGVERAARAEADLLVSWNIVITRIRKTYSVMRDASGSGHTDPSRAFGSAGGSSSRNTVVREVQEGEFAIDVFDRQANALVWSGSAHTRIDPETPLNESIVQVRGLVPLIMKKFPPK